MFRLASEHRRRLARAAKWRGQSIQKFIENIVLAEIEVEERRHHIRYDNYEPPPPEIGDEKKSSASGLGLADALKKKQEREEIAEPPAPAPVVVNVGSNGGSSASGDTIERLAKYVVEGSDFERDRRMRTACEVLKTNSSTEEERKVLAARLDEAVAAKTKTKPNGINIAKMAFDKLSSLITR
jgi:hypothetical protein